MDLQSKSIYTLVPDIYDKIKQPGWMDATLAANLSHEAEKRFQARTIDVDNRKGTLRLSRLGPSCPKALWHSIHTPELAEPLPPAAIIKYTYGHLIEALALCLARAAGHEVTGEQDAVSVEGILGHRDAVVDGCIVDVKSCSSRHFEKFKRGTISEDDPFGYLDQLDAYLVGSLDDPLVRNKSSAFILAVDKTLGHMVTYEHRVRQERIIARISACKRIVSSDQPPACECETVAEGRSGNLRLDTKASYSPYKYCCFPGLRTFLYSDGPRFLTHVERKPDVIEVDKSGRVVYN